MKSSTRGKTFKNRVKELTHNSVHIQEIEAASRWLKASALTTQCINLVLKSPNSSMGFESGDDFFLSESEASSSNISSFCDLREKFYWRPKRGERNRRAS